MKYHVEKRGYSRKPWRVVTEDGRELYARQRFDHPYLGMTVIDGPVAFDRKRDAVAWITSNSQA